MAAVRSAYRAQPLAAAPAAKKLTKAKLQEGFVDTLLNSVSILSEMMEDFRNSDRYFKYKAGVLAGWLFLTVSSFGVACPGQGPSNDIDAHLIVTNGTHGPVYMVKNDSQETWLSVKVVVNSMYVTTMNQIEPNGGIVLGASVIYDTNNVRAPDNLVITDIVVDVAEPSGQVHLLKNGQK